MADAPESAENRTIIPLADRTVIIATIIGISVAILLVEGYYNLANTFIGLILLATLHASDSKEDDSMEKRKRVVSLSFAAGWALAFILVVGLPLVNPYIQLSPPIDTHSCSFRPTSQEVSSGGYPVVTYQEVCDHPVLDPYRKGIFSIPVEVPRIVKFGALNSEAPNIVVGAIGGIVTLIVYCLRRLYIKHNRPSFLRRILEQKKREALQKQPSSKEIAVALALFNLPFILMLLSRLRRPKN